MYLRIVEAMAADIMSGRLARGQQLPTHRALARTLGIDVTTITRAYGEARRRGLLSARVGQGSFVSETSVRSAVDIPHPVKIDLSMNVPPHPVEANLEVRIKQGLAAIQHQSSLTAFLNYQRPGGSDREREIAATWLRTRVPHAEAERVVIFPGNQAAIFCTLLSLASPGDVVLTESLTFPGIKSAAQHLNIRLVGVPMDDGGIIPDALDAACRRYLPRAVYLVPTLQNPTTCTMEPSRRKAIADVIRGSETILIEDDAYGLLEPSASPIANLIPERTYLAVSFSKCIAPALRVSYLLVPDSSAEDRMRRSLQATTQMPPPLMVALATHWIETETCDQIIEAIRAEAIGRQQLASRILRGFSFAAAKPGHHLWLKLTRNWSVPNLVSRLLRDGVVVVDGAAFATGDNVPHAVRVSLGAARNRADLARAMNVLAAALKSQPADAQIV